MDTKYKFEVEVVAVDLEVLDFEYLKSSIVSSIHNFDSYIEINDIKLLFDTSQLGDNSVIKVEGTATILNQEPTLNNRLYFRRVINNSFKNLLSDVLNVTIYKITKLLINSL